MDFVAIDVETANADLSSICQVGLVRFAAGSPVEHWSTLINPQDHFDDLNIAIHGIDEDAVIDAPTWPDAIQQIRNMTGKHTLVSHGAFDRSSTTRACGRFDLPPLQCEWLDSCRVARRAWPDVAERGYGLAALAERFGIEFNHHDAAEDARAAGLVLVQAIRDTGLDLAGWTQRVQRPINPEATPGCHAMTGNPDGPLHGEIAVFTGELSTPRHEAAQLAATAGCEVADRVTKHTTLLIVGDQDIRKLAGKEKSAKHQKAEALIAKGKPLRIITESDFAALIAIG